MSARTAGHRRAPDGAVGASVADMVLVTEHRHGGLDLRLRPVLARPGPLQGPAGIMILLPQSDGLPGPSLGNTPFLQGGLFLIGSAPARSSDNAGVDRPAGHGRIPLALQPGIKLGEQVLNRIGAREVFAQQPDRHGVGDRVLQAEPQKAHERQPVPDLELRGVIRQRVERLKDEGLEHHNGIVGGAAASGAVGALQRRRQPQPLEIDRLGQPRQRVAILRKPPIPLIRIKRIGDSAMPKPAWSENGRRCS